jgi:O-antigen/teichoic acid export membrane protein
MWRTRLSCSLPAKPTLPASASIGDAVGSSDEPRIKSRGLISNSAWNYVGAVFTIIVTLITTPLYLNILGLERYGVLAVLAAILAPMGVLNAGVTQATVKFVADFSATRQLDAAREAVAASLLVNSVIGLVGALVCLVGAPYFIGLGFKVSPGLIDDAVSSLRLMGAVWLVSQIAGNFRGVIEGLRDQRRVMMGDALNTLLTATLCVSLGLATGKLSWFIGGQLLATSVVTAFWWYQAHRALHGMDLTWKVARGRVRQIYGYSSWQMINAAVAIAANVSDRYFIGYCLSAATLGAYNIALRVQAIGRTLFYSVNTALFPAASAASARPGASEKMVVQTTWHVALLAGLGLGYVAICGPAFLELWVGPAIAAATGFALRVLIVTLLFEIPSATGSSYLNAHAQTRLTAYNNVLTTVLTLGLMVPLGLRYGLDGVALSTLFGLALTRGPFHVWMHGRFFSAHVSRSAFLKAFYGVGLCCLTAILLVCPLFDMIFSRSRNVAGFLLASLSCGLLLLTLVLGFVLLVLGDRERLLEMRTAVAEGQVPLLNRFFRKGRST